MKFEFLPQEVQKSPSTIEGAKNACRQTSSWTGVPASTFEETGAIMERKLSVLLLYFTQLHCVH